MPDPNAEDFAPYNNKTAKENAEKTIKKLKGLYLELKAQIFEAESQVSLALKLKTDLHVNRLTERFKLCNYTWTTITKDVSKLVSLGEPEGSTAMTLYGTWEKQFQELSTKVNEAEGEIGEAIAERQLQAPPVAQAERGAPRPGMIKANDPLKPKELQLDDKPSVLRLFKREFQDYYDSNNMEKLSVRVQQSYFLQCISTKLKIKIRHMIMEGTTPVLAVAAKPGEVEDDSCYKFLDEIFKSQHPMVRRRQEFFMYMQKTKSEDIRLHR